MNRKPQMSFLRQAGRASVTAVVLGAACLNVLARDPDRAVSPQTLYNQGTQKLGEKKLREAEVLLQTAVATQIERVQGPALYNLGHVRFQQGLEELKKGPDAQKAKSGAQQADESGQSALRAVDAALASEDLSAMVNAYVQGRGARKELKAATEAVKQAMESKGTVLSKWQRASGDFKSARELVPADADAAHNAEVVDRSIAQLVDMIQMMMQNMDGMQQKRAELGKKMGQLRQKMPGDLGKQMKGGEEEDDEEEGKKPKEPQEGQKEGPVKDGKEMQMSAEEAERLLSMLRLDGNRKLSMGGDEPGKPTKGKLRDW